MLQQIVPLMQLLIHVENAIEHGIRNDPIARSLQISLKDERDHLHFQIIDDGIGRARAKEIGSRGTQQGTQMLKNLHQIFNAQNEDKIKSWYEDQPFTNQETKTRHGTIVHIKIPKRFNYVLTN